MLLRFSAGEVLGSLEPVPPGVPPPVSPPPPSVVSLGLLLLSPEALAVRPAGTKVVPPSLPITQTPLVPRTVVPLGPNEITPPVPRMPMVALGVRRA